MSRFGRAHPGGQRREADEVAPVDRQRINLIALDDGGHAGAADFRERRRGHHHDALAGGRREVEVYRDDLSEQDGDVVAICVANAGNAAETRYEPGGSAMIAYRPSRSVRASLLMPVSRLVATTVASCSSSARGIANRAPDAHPGDQPLAGSVSRQDRE